jgi:excisionase family DNA binding protein
MDTYLTVTEAASIVQLSEKYLYEAIRNGTIRTAMYQGSVLVNKQDAEALTPIWKRDDYDHSLSSKEIGIVEASDKYKIPHPTISRWVTAGRIRALRQDGRKKLISEGDIKYFAMRYHNAGGGQGRWVFDEHGNMYQKKTTGSLKLPD